MTRSGPADVCLVLEGTYPFVAGGVSSWVHHLVTRMPELRFHIVHISPSPGFHGGDHAYQVPPNVVGLEEVFLQKPRRNPRGGRRRGSRAIERFWRFVQRLRQHDMAAFEESVLALQAVGTRLPAIHSFLRAESSWDALLELYRDEAAQESFLNFFWTWLFAYEPLLNTVTFPIPQAHLYHTVSTGYAGVLAAAAHCKWQRPMILTEHGIYTKERRIEIHAASWIDDWRPEAALVEHQAPYFQLFWNRHFEAMSKICYAFADRIYTLYSDNVRAQIRDGARSDSIEVIPNGVDVQGLSAALARYREAHCEPNERFTVAFVGRVCPIKDVRTFLAAMRLVLNSVPDARIRLLGPMDEDPDYAADCRSFARDLGLGDSVAFEGRVSLHEELPKVDVVVLTSISEAQPLVVLEAGAMGIPVVCTDVGSCRELLEGRSPEDRAIGLGGLLTPIASPGATARAVLELHDDVELRSLLGTNLQTRVRRYYDQRQMIDAYREIYLARMPETAS